jgi:hypothetical protein
MAVAVRWAIATEPWSTTWICRDDTVHEWRAIAILGRLGMIKG